MSEVQLFGEASETSLTDLYIIRIYWKARYDHAHILTLYVVITYAYAGYERCT